MEPRKSNTVNHENLGAKHDRVTPGNLGNNGPSSGGDTPEVMARRAADRDEQTRRDFALAERMRADRMRQEPKASTYNEGYSPSWKADNEARSARMAEQSRLDNLKRKGGLAAVAGVGPSDLLGLPGMGMPNPAPPATNQPVQFTNCVGGGCYDTQGNFYKNGGSSTYYGPGGTSCQLGSGKGCY